METINPLEAMVGIRAMEILQRAPMPVYEGYEPDELAMMRIKRRVEEGRFADLSDAEQQWVCGRLIPSLTRYGCYPPPAVPTAPEEV